jgi:hypothetical protein
MDSAGAQAAGRPRAGLVTFHAEPRTAVSKASPSLSGDAAGRSPEMTRPSTGAGLCADCRHARPVETRRGTTFLLCGRAAVDARFARYPALPVLRCPGYEVVAPTPDSEES